MTDTLVAIRPPLSAASPLAGPRPMRWALIGIAVIFLALFLIVPLVSVFYEAFRDGAHAYALALKDPDAISAIWLTLTIAGIAVPMNLVFGLAAAWAIAKFEFVGKSVLSTLIDVPFAVSPVISGMVFILIFGQGQLLGPWVEAHNLHIIFAVPGMVLATTFVTFPFVARELIPLMAVQGTDAEQAAVVLGAGGWRTFFSVTLPSIKWALLYGTVLCAARAVGEFGAVSVVSGHIQGKTLTLPLYVELMSDNFDFVSAFAVSTLLVFLAMLTLIVKSFIEWRAHRASLPRKS
jgi:sulfate/thiosulfate transport system permease protein